MGYDKLLLFQVKKNNIWKTYEYYNCSGSYSAWHNHCWDILSNVSIKGNMEELVHFFKEYEVNNIPEFISIISFDKLKNEVEPYFDYMQAKNEFFKKFIRFTDEIDSFALKKELINEIKQFKDYDADELYYFMEYMNNLLLKYRNYEFDEDNKDIYKFKNYIYDMNDSLEYKLKKFNQKQDTTFNLNTFQFNELNTIYSICKDNTSEGEIRILYGDNP